MPSGAGKRRDDAVAFCPPFGETFEGQDIGMRMIRTAIATIALIALAPLPARAQTASCAWYADTSLKQQQQNDLRKCGFTGPEWNTSRPAHLAWCATQPPDSWKAQAQKREQMLAACKP
jgi:hypothetical protein